MNLREATIVYKRTPKTTARRFTSSRDAEHMLRQVCPDGMQERFVCIALDCKNAAVAWTTISTGSISQCMVDVADVLRFVLLAGAQSFIVAHNHPSGDPTPSAEDIALTERLRTAAQMVGLRLVDHIVLGAENQDGPAQPYFSFLDGGLIRGGLIR